MSGVVLAAPHAGETERLAGVSAADDVNGFNAAPIDRGDVAQVRDVRPMLGEHTAAVRVDLRLPHDGPTGPLEAEIQTSYSAEQ